MKYISLLRGINVSGQKKVKMLDLQSLYVKLGYINVTTYIQSGNVVFDDVSGVSNENNDSAENNADIKKKIEAGIVEQFDFTVPVEVITKSQWKKTVSQYPFTDIDASENATKVLVTFLSAKPDADNIEKLMMYVREPERLHIQDKTVYLYCPNGYGKTKLSNTFIEKKLSVTATTRNWKSVLKLLELVSEN